MHDERTGRLSISRKGMDAPRDEEMSLKNQRVKIRSSCAGYQDVGRNNIKIDVSRLLFHILNTLKKKDTSFQNSQQQATRQI